MAIRIIISCPICGMKARADRIFPKGFDPAVHHIEVKGDIITSDGYKKIKHDFRDVTGYLDNIKDAIIRKCEAIIKFVKGDEIWKEKKQIYQPDLNALRLPTLQSYRTERYVSETVVLFSRFLPKEILKWISPSVLKK